MTAALRLVPDLEPAGDDHWLTQTDQHTDAAEQQLIGALMYLSADEAQDLLDLVPDGAICDPTGRWTYELIRRIVRAGEDVDPVRVLGAGRLHAASQSLCPQKVPSPHQHHQLALYLVDACTNTPTPAALANCVRAVLDDAYRRAFDTFGLRMQELSASGADRSQLAVQFAAIGEELTDLWRRTETAERSRP
jgi:replicative DNA helicase